MFQFVVLPILSWFSEPSRAMLAIVVLIVILGYAWRRHGGWGWTQRKARTPDELLALTPKQFEWAIAEMLVSEGFRNVEVVGGAGDLAADIVCRDPAGRLTIVQRKRYSVDTRVGSQAIQTFIGMAFIHHGADRGIVVTTGSYTFRARELAAKHNVELFNGEELSILLT
jgi:restriction system protein